MAAGLLQGCGQAAVSPGQGTCSATAVSLLCNEPLPRQWPLPKDCAMSCLASCQHAASNKIPTAAPCRTTGPSSHASRRRRQRCATADGAHGRARRSAAHLVSAQYNYQGRLQSDPAYLLNPLTYHLPCLCAMLVANPRNISFRPAAQAWRSLMAVARGPPSAGWWSRTT